jgi:hypothetical protein
MFGLGRPLKVHALLLIQQGFNTHSHFDLLDSELAAAAAAAAAAITAT